MSIQVLRADGVRNLSSVEVASSPALNVFQGPNGAGKTSILESIHCLATGRSFRSGPRLAWLNRGRGRAEIFAQVDGHRLGMRQEREQWAGRIDGSNVGTRAELSQFLPFFIFHPESHALVEGAPEGRRRLVDLGVFHVEPAFLDHWRQFRRALGQRNAALKAGASVGELRVWEKSLIAASEALTEARRAYVTDLSDQVVELIRLLGARVPPVSLGWYQGWSADLSLAEALEQARLTDRDRGFTSVGPQRGDLRIRDEDGLVTGRYSRGQQKILVACVLFGQARLFEKRTEKTPIFAIDDVGSELDSDHEERMGRWLGSQRWQTWLTGLEAPEWLDSASDCKMFHVEQGRVRSVI